MTDHEIRKVFVAHISPDHLQPVSLVLLTLRLSLSFSLKVKNDIFYHTSGCRRWTEKLKAFGLTWFQSHSEKAFFIKSTSGGIQKWVWGKWLEFMRIWLKWTERRCVNPTDITSEIGFRWSVQRSLCEHLMERLQDCRWLIALVCWYSVALLNTSQDWGCYTSHWLLWLNYTSLFSVVDPLSIIYSIWKQSLQCLRITLNIWVIHT